MSIRIFDGIAPYPTGGFQGLVTISDEEVRDLTKETLAVLIESRCKTLATSLRNYIQAQSQATVTRITE